MRENFFGPFSAIFTWPPFSTIFCHFDLAALMSIAENARKPIAALLRENSFALDAVVKKRPCTTP